MKTLVAALLVMTGGAALACPGADKTASDKSDPKTAQQSAKADTKTPSQKPQVVAQAPDKAATQKTAVVTR